MLKRPVLTILCALLLAAAFFYGVARLFILRYERGDVYPPYSTLRADPLGAKAIHDALAEMPGTEVRRNYRPLPRLKPPQPVTIVYAGIARYSFWMEKELAEFHTLVNGGTRAVFAFQPIDMPEGRAEMIRAEEAARKKKKADAKLKKKQAAEKKDGSQPKPDEEGGEEDEKQDMISFKDVAAQWGFGFDYLPADKKGVSAEERKAFNRTAALMLPGAGMEPSLTWHSALFFTDLKPEWIVLYTCDLKPVVIERKMGEGSIILAADAFFLSNEALRDERHAGLLARVFAGPRAVVFDEEHHGIAEEPGIATLARKYRLHGFVAGLALLAALFVWKNAAPFIPPYDETRGEDEIIVGKESGEGFVNLLQRSIPPGEIVGVCVEEWRKACGHQARERAKLEQALQHHTPRSSPVENYRDLAQALTHKEPRHSIVPTAPRTSRKASNLNPQLSTPQNES